LQKRGIGKLSELAWQLDSSIRHGSVDKSSTLAIASSLESIVLSSLSALVATESKDSKIAVPNTDSSVAETIQRKKKRKREASANGDIIHYCSVIISSF
jgi:hypothetical protein